MSGTERLPPQSAHVASSARSASLSGRGCPSRAALQSATVLPSRACGGVDVVVLGPSTCAFVLGTVLVRQFAEWPKRTPSEARLAPAAIRPPADSAQQHRDEVSSGCDLLRSKASKLMV